jgi:hypothetical protein
MIPYWFLFFLPVLGLVLSNGNPARNQRLLFVFLWLVFSSVIGFRYQVGGDWFSYIKHLNVRSEMDLLDVLAGSDPGYYLINWLVAQLGGGIYWVNTICGMILMAGVVRFARQTPLPLLALLVAVPYMIIVVGMGYTRQSAALGLLLLGLVSLSNHNMRGFMFWTILGAAFHKSAVLMLPVAALASTSNRFWSLFWGGVISLAAAYLFVFDSAEALWTNYVEAQYHAQGGLIRVMMNAVPAALFLFLSRRMRLSEAEQKLWFWMSVLSLACIPLVVLSSTATDRVALYLIPTQLFVFAHLPFIAKEPRWRAAIALAVVCYYALVQFVWLVFASHSHAWLPYRVFWLI